MSNDKKIPITATGFDTLKDELRRLKTVDRPEIIEAIAEARKHGDLSENAEYHSAREKQGFIEGRIAELEDKTSRMEVIDVSKISGGTIKFGATVRLVDTETDEEISYQIVGVDEANIEHGKLSVSAPLARAIIGKEVGDCVEVSTPNGAKDYEVLEIQYK